MTVSCPAGSLLEHRLEVEAQQLFEALRFYLKLKGVTADEPNHYVARDAYYEGVDICGLVTAQETFPDAGVIYVTAPGIYFQDFLKDRHRPVVVHKHLLQREAVTSKGRQCKIQLRPNRGPRLQKPRGDNGWRTDAPSWRHGSDHGGGRKGGRGA
jgi:hypothetical protein